MEVAVNSNTEFTREMVNRGTVHKHIVHPKFPNANIVPDSKNAP